ncbi:MAG: PilZ domain-containing protein [Gammaproteobacteria bacterium]|nr:PilZ domain-containing protein [Gammaproteobacteria bacterium]MDH3411135.1 PilZ domain-containing protein [Gammaproteobacteria bacterium]
MSEYKRDHPRIKKSLPVEVIAPGDRTLFATTYDVSKRGVQLLCDGITVREIFGGPGLSRPTKPPTVLLKLRLGNSGREPEQIEAECRAVFSRRVSEQEYRVGLQIHSLPESSRMALDSFVDECLELN